MAKLEYTHPAKDDSAAYTETIEVRVWDLGGTPQQRFYIGSGLNFKAEGNLWIEVIYSAAGAQVFYTRSILNHSRGSNPGWEAKHLEEISQKGEGRFALGDMLPETGIEFSAEKKTYEDEDGEAHPYTLSKLVISLDTGVVFGNSSPGERSVEVVLKYVELQEGLRFLRELVHDIDELYEGKHPDPAGFPPGSSEWPFVLQLNRPAYNRIAKKYKEAYFENPVVAAAFEGWLAQLSPGGRVLDAGCGHGDPVIARLLEKGFQVTGADFSPEMVGMAAEKFPQAAFVQLPATQLAFEAQFDGACSFSSLLYLDPVDFYHAVHRLHGALKPGGLLFLYAFDTGPDWRGIPFHVVMEEWMWSWHYGMEEAAARLEEHGYFQVTGMQRVVVDEEKEKGYLDQLEIHKQKKEEYERRNVTIETGLGPFPLPFFDLPPERPSYGYVVMAKRLER